MYEKVDAGLLGIKKCESMITFSKHETAEKKVSMAYFKALSWR
jgi:hypothetical protein